MEFQEEIGQYDVKLTVKPTGVVTQVKVKPKRTPKRRPQPAPAIRCRFGTDCMETDDLEIIVWSDLMGSYETLRCPEHSSVNDDRMIA